MTSRNPLHHRRRLSTLLLAATTGLGALTLVAPTAQAAPVQPSRASQPGTSATTTGQAIRTPLVFAHRGASGHRPEHTLAAYQLAIGMGADYIEPDVVATKDGALVTRHENEISGTTDVSEHPEFAARRTTKTIDGAAITGWFTEDFTLTELKTLRAKERLPQVRPHNTRYDGRFEVPTLDEVLDLVARESKRLHRRIGVAPETKHPTYFDSIGLSLEEPLLRTLKRHHLDRPGAPVAIQSFEVGNLRELHTRTRLPLVQLVDASGAPYDQVVAGTGITYTSMVTEAGLADIATYADWLGAHKDRVLPRTDGAIGAPSPVVDDAHRLGLEVVVWTLRDENQFLPTNLRIGTDPNAAGDILGEVEAFLDAGVDGVFADYPDSAVAGRAEWLREQQAHPDAA